MNKTPLTLGYSPCPNDTYIFNALVNRRIESGLELAEPLLDDVETLNDWAMGGRLDITKVSCHALGHLLGEYRLLPSGAALGRGCGPLFITGSRSKPAESAWRIAIPGRYTTAALLLQLYRPGSQTVVMRFDRIMPAIQAGEVDAGVIIHESRFTYQTLGLTCIQDLGEWWERETGLPIPLGCILMRRSLGGELFAAVAEGIRASIRWADGHPEEGMAYIQQYAQEMDPAVMQSHINLYVNEFSKDIGEEGRAAIAELLRRGVALGLFPALPPEAL